MIRNLLYFAIFTTIIVASWLIFGIYHFTITSTINEDTGIIISPIPGKFDQATIDKLKTRKQIIVDLSETRNNSGTSTPAASIKSEILPTPIPTSPIIPIDSVTPAISSTPVASPSGVF